MAIHLDYANTLAALQGGVKEKGEDFIYVNREGISSLNDDGYHSGTPCHYVHGPDEPGCIVGNALHRLGVSLIALSEYEEKSAYQIVNGLVADEIITCDNDAKTLLILVQNKQDYGVSWGESVKYAIEKSA